MIILNGEWCRLEGPNGLHSCTCRLVTIYARSKHSLPPEIEGGNAGLVGRVWGDARDYGGLHHLHRWDLDEILLLEVVAVTPVDESLAHLAVLVQAARLVGQVRAFLSD